MKIAIGADHKGFPLKEKIIQILKKRNIEVLDFGTDSEKSVDYTDFGLKVARAVSAGDADLGITCCWTGNGMNMAANKIKGIRAGMALSPEMAYLTRLHNDANVLSLAAKFIALEDLEAILSQFLDTKFEGGRHVQRIEKMMKAQEEGC